MNGGKIEILTYENENGESLVFSHAAAFCPQEVTGLTDVRSTIYSIHSMGQDGDTYVASRIESREIDISGAIRERDPEKAREYRRKLARVLNPKLKGVLSYSIWVLFKDHRLLRVQFPRGDEKAAGDLSEVLDDALVSGPLLAGGVRAAHGRGRVGGWAGIPGGLSVANTVIGYRQRSVIVNVLNDGDVESGIRAEITAVSTVVNPKILNVTTGEFLRFILTLSAEDTLTVSTGYGEKGATYTHEGTTEDAQVSLSKGGTGQTSAAAARNALGLGNTTGALPVANGGTGASSAKAALQNLGIFYADTLPADGTDRQICLVPVG